MRYANLRKVLLAWGVKIGKGTGGSHLKFEYPGARRHVSLVLSKGQKSEITKKYVKMLCRNFGFDFEEFWADCNPSKASKAKAKAKKAAIAANDVVVTNVELPALVEETGDPDSNAA